MTYMDRAGVDRPTVVAGEVVLEAASPVVWFTFPGAHHDIGRFHTPAGDFTGWYANILTPVERIPPTADEPERWDTTDLFLDLFLTPAGSVHVLDREELEEAVARGWVDAGTAGAAKAEASRLEAAARSGTWPPAVTREWTLERARKVALEGSPGSEG